MNTTKLVICTLVGTAFIFLLDYLYYGLLGMGGTGEEMPDFLWLGLGLIIFTLMFCLIYAKGVESGASATQQGLRFGIMVGFLTAVAMGFMLHGLAKGTSGFQEWADLGSVLRDSAYEVVKFAILGIIVAHLSGLSGAEAMRGKTDPAPTPPPGGGN